MPLSCLSKNCFFFGPSRKMVVIFTPTKICSCIQYQFMWACQVSFPTGCSQLHFINNVSCLWIELIERKWQTQINCSLQIDYIDLDWSSTWNHHLVVIINSRNFTESVLYLNYSLDCGNWVSHVQNPQDSSPILSQQFSIWKLNFCETVFRFRKKCVRCLLLDAVCQTICHCSSL